LQLNVIVRRHEPYKIIKLVTNVRKHPRNRFVRAVCESTYLVVLAWIASACTTWGAQNANQLSDLNGRGRVVLTDGSRLDLQRIRVSTDSVFGIVRRHDVNERVAISRGVVIAVQRREFSPARTIGLFAGLAVASVVLFYVAFCLAVCNDPNY
jgi:hypothetical protein